MEEAEPARKDATPPPTDAERLWARYQLPKGKARPTDRQPLGRYDWNLLILRLDIPTHVKAIAGALAALARADGSNVITTDPCLPAAFDINERQLRRHVAVLHGLKLLEVVEQPGGRGVPKTVDEKRRVRNAIVCQLTEPVDGRLPYRLDADFLPIEQRQPGAAPFKAIEASRAARARNTGSPATGASDLGDQNPGSPPTAATTKHRYSGYQGNDETPVAGLPEQEQSSGSGATAVSGTAPWKQRQPGYRGNDETPVAGLPQQAENTGSPATDATAAERENPGSGATGESGPGQQNAGTAATAATPVDDEKHRQSGYRGRAETPVAGLPKHRYSGYRSNENTGTPATGAASRVEVLKNPSTKNSLNPNTSVVQLGGDLTSGHGADDETRIDPSQPDPSQTAGANAAPDADPADEPELDEPRPSTLAGSFQPTDDAAYDAARTRLFAVPVDELNDLLADAQGELEFELARQRGANPDAALPQVSHRQIALRAAEIVRRAETAGHGPDTDQATTEGTES